LVLVFCTKDIKDTNDEKIVWVFSELQDTALEVLGQLYKSK